jgi:hypothetical protein
VAVVGSRQLEVLLVIQSDFSSLSSSCSINFLELYMWEGEWFVWEARWWCRAVCKGGR